MGGFGCLIKFYCPYYQKTNANIGAAVTGASSTDSRKMKRGKKQKLKDESPMLGTNFPEVKFNPEDFGRKKKSSKSARQGLSSRQPEAQEEKRLKLILALT